MAYTDLAISTDCNMPNLSMLQQVDQARIHPLAAILASSQDWSLRTYKHSCATSGLPLESIVSKSR